MLFKDQVCMWFKDNESHSRLELLCGLLNMCLPFELRYIRTCVEDLGKRDDLLRDFDSKANNSLEISQLGKILDERTRSKFVVYVALLEANNQTCSKILFETLSNAQQIPNSALNNNLSDNINYIKEMLLIYTMVLHHPAFTFEEKRVIGERFQSLQVLEEEICKNKKFWNHKETSLGLEVDSQDLSIESCHPISSPQVIEACDSGLSIGTESEVLSDHMCIQASHGSCNSSSDNTFEDIVTSKENMTTSGPMLNPSIGTRNCDKSPCSSNLISSSASLIIPLNSSTDSRPPCPSNRDASSSGSGESLDLYGESASVPTTYIYNSNIYEHQNISEVPAMALSNNLINLTPGYMYQHNGRCHFYHCPPLGGDVLPSVSVPPPPAGMSSETSSSSSSSSGEEGGGGAPLLPLPGGPPTQRSPPRMNSPLSSSQSSPYASPPQSLTPSRASSPKETSTVTPTFVAPAGLSSASSSQVSHGLVTGTTTTIVISKSSPNPPIRHNSSSSSSSCSNSSTNGGSNSHPSSPALTSCNQVNRNNTKTPVISNKSVKYVASDRPNNRNRNSPNNAQTESVSSGLNSAIAPHSNKESVNTNLYSSNAKDISVALLPNKTRELKSCARSVESVYKPNVGPNCVCLPGTGQQDDGVVKTVASSSTVPNVTVSSSNSFKSNCSVVSSSISVVPLNNMQTGSHNNVDAGPVKIDNIKNLKDEKHHVKEDSPLAEIKTVYETEKMKLKQNFEEKGLSFATLPNGFNECLLISSAHSVPLKHSNVQTSSVPSCSCTHLSGATVSLQSEPCKISLSNNANASKQRTIPPPVSQYVGSDNLCIKPNQNKHIFSSETLPHNVLPSPPMTAVTHTVPSKMQYNVPLPAPESKSSAAERVSSPPAKQLHQITSISTNSPVNSSSQTSIYTVSSSKYTASVTNSNSNANTSHSLMSKPSVGENGSHVHTSIPSSQGFVGSSAKTTVMGCNVPTYTTTTNTNATIMSVPSPGGYHHPYLISILPGGGSSYLPQPQGAFSHHHPHGGHPRNSPHHPFFIVPPSGMVQGPSAHLMKGPPHIMPPPHSSNMHHSNSSTSKVSRGNNSSGRSGSSSSSSSSGGGGGLGGRKKGFLRGAGQYQSKSRSSDSSPSSSQYSSPPQTPSPDHTKDARSKQGGPVPAGKQGEGYSMEEVWEPPESGVPCLPCPGSREEGTPPPNPMGPHLMFPPNAVRQRYNPYHPPIGFISYPAPHSHSHPHPGMYRYSLASPSVVMGPRPPTPLSSDKSSRETTPPNNHSSPHSPMVGPPPIEPPQKGMDYPGPNPAAASSSASFNMGPVVVSTPSMAASSTSPPIPLPEPSLVPSPGHSGPPNGAMTSTMHPYNHPYNHMFAMGAGHFLTHLPAGFMPSSSGLPNGFVPHNLPPSFPVPLSSGGDLVYPSPPYPPGMAPPPVTLTSSSSSCGGSHPILHQHPSGGGGHPPAMPPPSAALPPSYSPSYQPPPPPANPVPPPVKKPLTCYNCGQVGHRGSECKEASIDEMTKRTKVL